ENTAIPLTVNAALVDADGSETMSLQIGAIPVGATLSDGTHSFTATAGNTTADVTGWTLGSLTITPPLNDVSDFTLTLSATSTETANGESATSPASLAVTALGPLFPAGNDSIDFASVTAGSYIAGSQYDALGGDDSVILPTDAAAAAAAGYDLTQAFHGNAGNDSIVGSSLADRLFGDAGNDTIRGGAANDTLDGGAGTDTIDYSAAAAGVTINMATGAVTGGDGNDQLTGFENIVGSGFADVVTGVSAGVIDLGGGADSLTLINGST